MHPFILSPGTWVGEGKIRLNMVEEELSFFTRWNIENREPAGSISCLQEIQIKGLSDIMNNEFSFYDLAEKSFAVDLENQALGRVAGKGVISDQVIAWEFRVPEIDFEGFELYEKQSDESYLMRAEYANDQFRTVIQGKIWRKEEEDKKGEPLR